MLCRPGGEGVSLHVDERGPNSEWNMSAKGLVHEFLDVDHTALVIKYVLAVIFQKIHRFPRF